MKKLISSLFALSLVAITGCNQASETIGITPDQALSNVSASSAKKTKLKVNTDWYENLRPDLQKYYAAAKGKTGNDLFMALHKIVTTGYKVGTYQEAKSFMYATADNIKVNGKPGVIDAYSQVFVAGSGGNGNSYLENGDENKDGKAKDFINCEHTWPQSYFNKQAPMVADLNHMQSTLALPNEMRGHYAFGEAVGQIPYTTSGGAKLGVTDLTGKNRSVDEIRKILALPYEQSSVIMNKEFDSVFEPPTAQKGNTARCMLYFMLAYYDKNIRQGDFDKEKFWDSKVSTFAQWSEAIDPVNEQEQKRNDTVFKKQGNRNPFIDIPGLATLIGEDVLKSK